MTEEQKPTETKRQEVVIKTDYQGNSNRAKESGGEKAPEKKIEKVIVGEVVRKKEGIGRKFKKLFIKEDLGTVSKYVFVDLMIPAAIGLVLDNCYKGLERMFYGERAVRTRNVIQGGRTSFYAYNNPVQRNNVTSEITRRLTPSADPRLGRGRAQDSFILSDREDAETVVERLCDIIDQYQVATVQDLYELLGQPSSHIDTKWGWADLSNVKVLAVQEGFLIDFPQPIPIGS